MAVVGKASEIQPGTIRSFEVDGEAVAVANVGGTFYAFSDTCTHRGCSLAEGELDNATVICACHGGTFDLKTGEVLDGPPPAPVKTYACSVENDDLVVS